MQQRKSKKILIYFFLLLLVGSINNSDLFHFLGAMIYNAYQDLMNNDEQLYNCKVDEIITKGLACIQS